MIKNQTTMIWVLSGVILILGFIHLLIQINPIALDDAYVYYTYANNMVEGRPFAYDVRNIPSEGFTSLLYLLLLTPFEYFHINMLFASFVINILAIMITVIGGAYLVNKSGVINKASLAFFVSLVWFLIVTDGNIIHNLNIGLETMLGPMSIILTCVAFSETYSQNTKHQNRALNVFFIMLFVCYIIRPENMVFASIIGIPILLLSRKIPLRLVIRKSIIFGVFFIAYHLIKLAIFGDILPTGFYRKVGGVEGGKYVINWVEVYGVWFLLLLLINLVDLRRYFVRKPRILLQKSWVLFFSGILIQTVVFFARTQPLVGYSYRFFMTPIFILYITISFMGIWSILRLSNRFHLKQYVPAFYSIVLVGLILSSITNINNFIATQNPNLSLLEHINIYAKGQQAQDNQTYLDFGYYLNTALDNPKDVTLVFGDAGAIPYAFDGKFIDSNGLAETPIAHLFSKPDGAEKTRLFTDYILSQNPDMVVLGWNKLDDNGYWEIPLNIHSPFRNPSPIALYQSFYDYGIRYGCSIYSNYYDIHIGVRLTSPHYESIVNALSNYCQTNGYILPDGFIVTNGSEKLQFEGVIFDE